VTCGCSVEQDLAPVVVALVDPVGVAVPCRAVAFAPKSAPRFGYGGRLEPQKVVHRAGAPTQHRHQLATLVLIKAIGVDESAQPRRGIRSLVVPVG
jgi:hypothetical protein